MNLYNSPVKEKQAFSPIADGVVKLYSCGPTVYNNLHIGNLSAFIYADLLRRVLAEQFDIHHVMNITDVDDKTIRDSKRDYPDDDPMAALKKLTDKYTKVFLDDLKATGNDLDAIEFISAVDTIDEMIALIQKIIDNGFAYEAEDGIYFSIKAYTEAGNPYGVLQHVDTSHSQSRVNNDEYDKDAASDFALWKRTEAGEPSWDASYAIGGNAVDMPGRPGWHIECSAMSEKLLGVPFDIHTGGIDLKFPHHENEIAQTCGSGAESLANYFVHNNHILVDGRKMSKSLGNFYTLRDIEEKGFTGQDFRMLVLEGHYQSESNFSWDILTAAKNRRQHWQSTIDLMHQLPSAEDADVMIEATAALQDNLNTPECLRIIGQYFEDCEKQSHAPHENVIAFIERALGLTFNGEDASSDVKKLLDKRAQARADKDWQASDDLRDKLQEQGIAVKDSADCQLWSRI